MYVVFSLLVCKFCLSSITQDGLYAIHTWLLVNRLSLNVSKTNSMLFGPKLSAENKTNFVLNIKNEVISVVDQAKFVGLVIVNKLSWDCHINSVVKKLNFSTYTVQPCSNALTLHSRYY